MYWFARCKYKGKDTFSFYSSEFRADWKLEDEMKKAQEIVLKEWATISPHPPPDMIELVPVRGYEKDELRKDFLRWSEQHKEKLRNARTQSKEATP